MGFAKVHSGQSYYLKGQIIDVEVDLSRGLHSFTLVGLPDKSVEEAKDRISAAIKNSGYVSPKQKNQRVVISLAPAHVRKEGSHFDLAMALGYLLASEEISFNPNGRLFVGELSLDGALRKVHGVLSVVIEAKRLGFQEIYIPAENVGEAALVDGVQIFGANTLKEAIEHLDEIQFEKTLLPKFLKANFSEKNQDGITCAQKPQHKLEEIIGQPLAKRGLEIAASGGHNILFSGPPGTGKTMLANALRDILPSLSTEHALEVTSIHSSAGLASGLISHPPFRAPHHASSHSALIGGGNIPRPGEVTLAHRGVLFLDEFPEFERRVIETLRQPLEERVINITRAKISVNYPAHFILVAAMNPCPCGFLGSRKNKCACSARDIANYRKKISGPILDRIDLFVEVGDVEFSKVTNDQATRNAPPKFETENGSETETEKVLQNIRRARKVQAERFAEKENSANQHNSQKLNSDMAAEDLALRSYTAPKAAATLIQGAESFNLSMRSYHRVWRVARTVADLASSHEILEEHVLEALQFRNKN